MPLPPPSARSPRRLFPVAFAVLVLAAGGCGSDGSGAAPAPPGTYDRLTAGLCEARAAAGRPADARIVFFDRAHQALHELAAAVAAEDRSAAARLLEAKQAVEADLEGDGATLAADLDALLAASRHAVTAAGEPDPPPCQEAP